MPSAGGLPLLLGDSQKKLHSQPERAGGLVLSSHPFPVFEEENRRVASPTSTEGEFSSGMRMEFVTVLK